MHLGSGDSEVSCLEIYENLPFSLSQPLLYTDRKYFISFFIYNSSVTPPQLCSAFASCAVHRGGLLLLEPYSLKKNNPMALTPLSHSATLTGFTGLNKACLGEILIKLTLD